MVANWQWFEATRLCMYLLTYNISTTLHKRGKNNTRISPDFCAAFIMRRRVTHWANSSFLPATYNWLMLTLTCITEPFFRSKDNRNVTKTIIIIINYCRNNSLIYIQKYSILQNIGVKKKCMFKNAVKKASTCKVFNFDILWNF